jgi:putative thioredoxin
MSTQTSYEFDVGGADFDVRVLEASRSVPVLVDFWAAWCGPCQSLGPILSRLAAEYGGRFLLAKVDTDTGRQLAADHGIRSLPTVRLFKGAATVAEFMGLQPEPAIRALLDEHVPRASDDQRVLARELREAGDRAGALAALGDAARADPDNFGIQADLIDLLVDTGALDDAEQRLRALPAGRRQDHQFLVLEARLGFARIAQDAPDTIGLEGAIEADPSDCDARYRLSARQVAAGDYEAALEQLLQIMRRDRRYGDDAGRKGMLSVFEILGAHDEVVDRYRSKMAAALY